MRRRRELEVLLDRLVEHLQQREPRLHERGRAAADRPAVARRGERARRERELVRESASEAPAAMRGRMPAQSGAARLAPVGDEALLRCAASVCVLRSIYSALDLRAS